MLFSYYYNNVLNKKWTKVVIVAKIAIQSHNLRAYSSLKTEYFLRACFINKYAYICVRQSMRFKRVSYFILF